MAEPIDVAADDELGTTVAQVVEIWRSVVGNPQIDADSNLLDVGGTSLTAVRIRARIRTELGKDLDLLDFLDYPTPRELSTVIATSPDWTGPAAMPAQ